MKKSIFSVLTVMVLIFTVFICSLNTSYASSSDELVRDIILINGQAELVEMDHEGEILHRLVAIPDYFSSRRSHQNQKIRSLHKAGFVGSVELKTCPTVLANHFLKSGVCHVESNDQTNNSNIASLDISNDIDKTITAALDLQSNQSAQRIAAKKVKYPSHWVADRKSLMSAIKIKHRSSYLS